MKHFTYRKQHIYNSCKPDHSQKLLTNKCVLQAHAHPTWLQHIELLEVLCCRNVFFSVEIVASSLYIYMYSFSLHLLHVWTINEPHLPKKRPRYSITLILTYTFMYSSKSFIWTLVIWIVIQPSKYFTVHSCILCILFCSYHNTLGPMCLRKWLRM